MAPKGKGKPKPRGKQTTLGDIGVQRWPLLSKPASAVGKEIKVPGKYWGAACPASDAEQMFVCAIVDYLALHKWPGAEAPSEAIKLTEMGVDGTGGNSVDFFMKYPLPFLEFYYESYPLDAPVQPSPGPGTPADGGLSGSQASSVPRGSTTSIYEHLQHISTERNGGRLKQARALSTTFSSLITHLLSPSLAFSHFPACSEISLPHQQLRRLS